MHDLASFKQNYVVTLQLESFNDTTYVVLLERWYLREVFEQITNIKSV